MLIAGGGCDSAQLRHGKSCLVLGQLVAVAHTPSSHRSLHRRRRTDPPLATDALAAHDGDLYVGGSTQSGQGVIYQVKP
jgi:hypothetical protein